MPTAIICAQGTVETQLTHTVLFRDDVERIVTRRADQARMMILAARPELVVVDRDLPGATELLEAIRDDPGTRKASVVVLGHGDFEPSEVDLLTAGANAIVRLPVDREANDRLARLLEVPPRREARLPVHLAVEADFGSPARSLLATALNLSESGMLLETTTALALGDDLSLRFRLEEGGGIEADGRVVRLAGRNLYGIAFGAVPGEARGPIREYVGGAGG